MPLICRWVAGGVLVLLEACAAPDGANNSGSPAAKPPASANVAPVNAAPATSAMPAEPQVVKQAVAEPAAVNALPGGAPPASMTLREAQKRLAALGYQPGSADGKTGPRTREALKKFQKDSGLKVSGLLDAETMQRLMAAGNSR